MSDIFISYANEDRPRAQMIVQALEGRGWSIFWDRTIPIGKTWRGVIGKELNEARCVIVLWSKNSIESNWVLDEADDAARRGILVPVRIENIDPPFGYRQIQAADLDTWDATKPTDALRTLTAAIATLIGSDVKSLLVDAGLKRPEGRESSPRTIAANAEGRKLTKQQHLDRTRIPKRILSLDGGGIRGILTLEYLGAIEELLRGRSGKTDLLLCDYFDLIGGTSTGSIIAAGLACGMTVDQLKQLYTQIGASVFQGTFLDKLMLRGLWAPKFPVGPLREELDKQLGANTTLDSDRIRTGLMIMMKRFDTGSSWPLHNHPDAKYARQDGALRLTQAVRASTAAPTYFEPERIAISSRDGSVGDAAFVDGGVSPFNDPALQLLMLAALNGHGFRWLTGKNRLLLISIGTGGTKKTFSADAFAKMSAAEQGLRSLTSLMEDIGDVNHGMMQWLTNCLTPWTIDRAVGDMRLDSQSGPQLATYARYNVVLDADWLKNEVAIDRPRETLAKIAAMDDPTNMDELAEIGRLAAKQQVKPEDFPAAFDLD